MNNSGQCSHTRYGVQAYTIHHHAFQNKLVTHHFTEFQALETFHHTTEIASLAFAIRLSSFEINVVIFEIVRSTHFETKFTIDSVRLSKNHHTAFTILQNHSRAKIAVQIRYSATF